MSKELIERIEKFRERGCDTETHVLLCDCRDELTKQADQIETLRMQLAACDVAALQNTRESLETRIPKDNPYYSAAYRSVCDAVDREIAHREGCTKQAERIEKLRTKLSAQMHQTQITAQQIHDAVLAAIKRGTTFPDGIDEQGHPIEQLVGMIVTTLQLKLDEQAERVKALEEYRDANEDLVSTLLDSLEKIESHFSDRGELEGEGKWRLDSIYKAVQQANEAVDKCVAARKQSQLAAVLKEGERKPSIDVIAEMAKHEDGGISVGGLMGDQCGVCGIGFCLPSGRCDHCNAVLKEGE